MLVGRFHARHLITFMVLLLLSAATYGADVNGDGLEVVLFPLAFNIGSNLPGAFGTSWGGEAWYDYRSRVPVRFPTPSCGGVVCPVFQGEPTPFYFFDTWHAPERGFVFWVPAQLADKFTFSNRIFERTLRAQPRGVDIPVVREGEFFDSEQTFLGVPAGSGVRISLRAYDPWLHHQSRPGPPLEAVRVEVQNEQLRPIGTAMLRPGLPHPISPYGEDMNKPGFDAILDLAAAIPAFPDRHRVHIRVTPVPAGAQYWAFVAVTDNETQTVSIITAQ